MSARTCTCGRPVQDQDVICKDCVQTMRQHLSNQTSHYESLLIELARWSKKLAANDGGRASSETAWIAAGDKHLDEVTPENLREWDRRARAASNALSAQRVLLVSWTRLLVEEGYAAELPADRIPALAMFIEAHLADLRKHDAAGELVAEFRDLTARILRVIDLPEFRTRINAGPCPQKFGTDHCIGEVEAIIPADEAIRPLLRCPVCKSEWPAEQWARTGALIQARHEQIQGQRKMAEAMARKAS